MKKKISEQNLSKIALKNSSYNFISTMVLKLGGLIFTIIIARMLLPELFGMYALVLSIVTLILTFGELGIGGTAVRYISDSLGKANKIEARSYTRFFIKKKIILTIISVIILLAISKYLSYSIYENPLIFYPLIFSCLFIISDSFREFISIFFVINKNMKPIIFLDLVFQILKILFSIFALLIFSNVFKLSGIFLAFFGASFITVILSILVLLKKDKDLFFGKIVKINRSRVNSYWKFLILTSITLTLFGSIDTLMIGRFVPMEYLGYYRAAISLSVVIASLLSLSGIFLPIFTQIHGERFRRGFYKTMKYLLILSIPSTTGILFLGKDLIKLIYGSEYLGGVIPFYFLAPLIITAPLISLYLVLFKSKEKPKILSKAVLISLISNIFLNVVAIFIFKENPLYLIAGIALATILSRIIFLIILILNSKKKFNLKIKEIESKKPLFASGVMALFLILYNQFLELNLILGALEIILGVVIYLGVLILIKGLTEQDLKIFKSLFKK